MSAAVSLPQCLLSLRETEHYVLGTGKGKAHANRTSPESQAKHCG